MSEAGEEMPLAQRVAWGALILVIVGLVGAAMWGRYKGEQERATPPSAAPQMPPKPMRVGDFAFADQHGKPMTAKDLKGRVWIASFIFTRCAGTCIVVTSNMAALNRELADAPDVRLVSFSMDPEFDTPEVLEKYAKSQGAESPRWFFLTGKKADIHRLTRDDFKLVVTEEGGTKEEPIVHATKLVLVDQSGQIRGYFSGLELDTVKVIAAEARKLMQSKPKE